MTNSMGPILVFGATGQQGGAASPEEGPGDRAALLPRGAEDQDRSH